MNYFKATIKLDEPATTIPIMEWIRDHGCPELDHTFFADKYGDKAIVSYMHESECGATIEYLQTLNSKDDWFEYKGMKRRHDSCGWIFLIEGNYYFATF